MQEVKYCMLTLLQALQPTVFCVLEAQDVCVSDKTKRWHRKVYEGSFHTLPLWHTHTVINAEDSNRFRSTGYSSTVYINDINSIFQRLYSCYAQPLLSVCLPSCLPVCIKIIRLSVKSCFSWIPMKVAHLASTPQSIWMLVYFCWNFFVFLWHNSLNCYYSNHGLAVYFAVCVCVCGKRIFRNIDWVTHSDFVCR